MLIGHDVLDEHCHIVCTNGKVHLHPIAGGDCAINGKAITEPTKLTQGKKYTAIYKQTATSSKLEMVM